MKLTVDFADASLEGRIYNFLIQENGTGPYISVPLSSVFRIHDGRIVDSQFTAKLTGEDDDPTVAFEDSARGFEGDMLGTFYGSEAAEVGGVLNAKRDSGGEDQVFVGRFGGSKERDIAIDSSAQLSASVHRDWVNDSTSLSDASAMVEPSGDGYRVTFTIDGTTTTVDVTEADLGSLSAPNATYAKSTSTPTVSNRGYLWREWPGRFPGQPGFDYLDVNGVLFLNYTPGEEQTVDSIIDGENAYVIRGTRTMSTDMPSGSASYSGRMQARAWDITSVGSSLGGPRYRGEFGMTADFGGGTVAATVSNVGQSPDNSSAYTPISGTGLTFQATVSGNAFTASALTGTGEFAGYSGSAEGAFYGPQAAEAGGVFSGENTANSRVLHGWFAGDKE